MKRIKTFQAVLSTAALLGTIAVAQAAPTNITTRDGRGADATVQGGEFATRNIGTHPLWVKNSRLSNFVRNFYLRFDLAKATTTLANLEKAEIQLTTIAPVGATPTDKEWTFRVWGLPDADAGEEWDEKTLSWDTAPGRDVNAANGLAATALALGSFKIVGAGTEGEVVAFSSPELAQFIKSDTNKLVTFIVTRDERESSTADNISHGFAPKEQSKVAKPTLALTFKP